MSNLFLAEWPDGNAAPSDLHALSPELTERGNTEGDLRWGGEIFMLLYLLAAASLFMLWRDWKSGRIYYLPRYGGLKYEDPDPFWERERTPILYWGIWITVGSCGAVSALLELLSSLGLTGRINEDFRVIIFLLGIGIQSFYFLGGLGGRFVSWVKNYGSVDKQW